MPRFQTLTQRLGALYAFVGVLVLGVCAAAILQLRLMRLDSKRLLEESHEQSAATGLVSALESLEALVQTTDIDPQELERARTLVTGAYGELDELDGHPNDPSRPEHQRKEEGLVQRLHQALQRVDEILASERDGAGNLEALDHLALASRYTQELLSEAREEARESYRDLGRRARTTRLYLMFISLGALLLLSVALLLFHRAVVRPIRRLRQGAERFGHGDRKHRIRIDSRDEIGDLADSFNSMADRLASSQEDLEERVRTRTREFIRAARLADLGILASGIAHEINTPLASISTSAQGLQRRLQRGDLAPDQLEEYSRVITQESLRAREITTRMLALVRQEPNKIARVSLQVVGEQATSALRHRADSRRVSIKLEALEGDPFVDVDAGELIQILMNLLANAIDASAAGGQVDLRMRVREGELQIEVSDQGSGIPEEDMERIFEPFFTTKSPGNGTGLGLALVATMVSSHRGHVSVQSEPRHGTTFRITLPTDWSSDE